MDEYILDVQASSRSSSSVDSHGNSFINGKVDVDLDSNLQATSICDDQMVDVSGEVELSNGNILSAAEDVVKDTPPEEEDLVKVEVSVRRSTRDEHSGELSAVVNEDNAEDNVFNFDAGNNPNNPDDIIETITVYSPHFGELNIKLTGLDIHNRQNIIDNFRIQVQPKEEVHEEVPVNVPSTIVPVVDTENVPSTIVPHDDTEKVPSSIVHVDVPSITVHENVPSTIVPVDDTEKVPSTIVPVDDTENVPSTIVHVDIPSITVHENVPSTIVPVDETENVIPVQTSMVECEASFDFMFDDTHFTADESSTSKPVANESCEPSSTITFYELPVTVETHLVESEPMDFLSLPDPIESISIQEESETDAKDNIIGEVSAEVESNADVEVEASLPLSVPETTELIAPECDLGVECDADFGKNVNISAEIHECTDEIEIFSHIPYIKGKPVLDPNLDNDDGTLKIEEDMELSIPDTNNSNGDGLDNVITVKFDTHVHVEVKLPSNDPRGLELITPVGNAEGDVDVNGDINTKSGDIDLRVDEDISVTVHNDSGEADASSHISAAVNVIDVKPGVDVTLAHVPDEVLEIQGDTNISIDGETTVEVNTHVDIEIEADVPEAELESKVIVETVPVSQDNEIEIDVSSAGDVIIPDIGVGDIDLNASILPSSIPANIPIVEEITNVQLSVGVECQPNLELIAPVGGLEVEVDGGMDTKVGGIDVEECGDISVEVLELSDETEAHLHMSTTEENIEVNLDNVVPEVILQLQKDSVDPYISDTTISAVHEFGDNITVKDETTADVAFEPVVSKTPELFESIDDLEVVEVVEVIEVIHTIEVVEVVDGKEDTATNAECIDLGKDENISAEVDLSLYISTREEHIDENRKPYGTELSFADSRISPDHGVNAEVWGLMTVEGQFYNVEVDAVVPHNDNETPEVVAPVGDVKGEIDTNEVIDIKVSEIDHKESGDIFTSFEVVNVSSEIEVPLYIPSLEEHPDVEVTSHIDLKVDDTTIGTNETLVVKVGLETEADASGVDIPERSLKEDTSSSSSSSSDDEKDAHFSMGFSVSVDNNQENGSSVEAPDIVSQGLDVDDSAADVNAEVITISADINEEVTTTVCADIGADVTTTISADIEAEVTPAISVDIEAEVTPAISADIEAEVTPTISADIEAEVTTTISADIEAEVTPTISADIEAEVTPTISADIEAEITTAVCADIDEEVTTKICADIDSAVPTIHADINAEVVTITDAPQATIDITPPLVELTPNELIVNTELESKVIVETVPVSQDNEIENDVSLAGYVIIPDTDVGDIDVNASISTPIVEEITNVQISFGVECQPNLEIKADVVDGLEYDIQEHSDIDVKPVEVSSHVTTNINIDVDVGLNNVDKEKDEDYVPFELLSSCQFTEADISSPKFDVLKFEEYPTIDPFDFGSTQKSALYASPLKLEMTSDTDSINSQESVYVNVKKVEIDTSHYDVPGTRRSIDPVLDSTVLDVSVTTTNDNKREAEEEETDLHVYVNIDKIAEDIVRESKLVRQPSVKDSSQGRNESLSILEEALKELRRSVSSCDDSINKLKTDGDASVPVAEVPEVEDDDDVFKDGVHTEIDPSSSRGLEVNIVVTETRVTTVEEETFSIQTIAPVETESTFGEDLFADMAALKADVAAMDIHAKSTETQVYISIEKESSDPTTSAVTTDFQASFDTEHSQDVTNSSNELPIDVKVDVNAEEEEEKEEEDQGINVGEQINLSTDEKVDLNVTGIGGEVGESSNQAADVDINIELEKAPSEDNGAIVQADIEQKTRKPIKIPSFKGKDNKKKKAPYFFCSCARGVKD